MHPTTQKQAADENTSPEQLRMLVAQSIEILRLVANNPSADPELLRELASNAFAKILEGVASNPNTPTDVLFDLGQRFPGQLLNNPVFSLLMLENPNLLEQMSFPMQSALYEHSECPETAAIAFAL